MKLFAFDKSEKLKSKKDLEKLFTSGKHIYLSPIKLYYIVKSTEQFDVKAGVGVSSRYFKNAVDRNYIKRQLREGYRLEKIALHQFLKQSNLSVQIFFLYTSKLKLNTKQIQQLIQKIIQKLISQIEKMD